jgi:hypothetical protein
MPFTQVIALTFGLTVVYLILAMKEFLAIDTYAEMEGGRDRRTRNQEMLYQLFNEERDR